METFREIFTDYDARHTLSLFRGFIANYQSITNNTSNTTNYDVRFDCAYGWAIGAFIETNKKL